MDLFTKTKRDYLLEGSLFDEDHESILVFGGVDPHASYGVDRNTGDGVYRFSQNGANSWAYVSKMPEPRHHHSVVFLGGKVYLAGGADPRRDFSGNFRLAENSVWSFDPVRRVWYSESSMGSTRKNFGLVLSNLCLYAIGGQDNTGRILSSVEKYNPATKAWEDVAPMLKPRMGLACAKYKNSIWVVGGMTASRRNPLHNTVECYDVSTNNWTLITRSRHLLGFGRLNHVDNHLYLIGGAGKLSSSSDTLSLSIVEVWDSEQREFTSCGDLATPRHGHATTVMGQSIYVIGGVTTTSMKALATIEVFDATEATRGKLKADLPTPLSGHGAVTLPPASFL